MMAPETVVTVDNNKPNTPQQAPTGPRSPSQDQGPLDWIKFDLEYFKSHPGLLKIAELILGILCMALASPSYSGWFVFVAVICFIITMMWSFVHLLSIKQVLKVPINWVLSELVNTGVETFFYLIAFIVLFASAAERTNWYNYGSNIAAAVFGIFNTACYAGSTFLLFKEHRNTPAPTA